MKFICILHAAGSSLRLCEYGGIWQQPNVSSCATQQFIDIRNMVIYGTMYCYNYSLLDLCFVVRGIEYY